MAFRPRLLVVVPLFVGAHLSCAAPESAGSLRPWETYRTIMWVGNSAKKNPQKLPAFYQRLREMGINAVTLAADANPEPVAAAGFGYYVENVVNRGLCLKFNSNVRDWDKFVTAWARDGRPDSALVRDYCLDDPKWREWARGEVRAVAARNRAQEPFAYDLRDELSTTISANPFDYDFNPIALDGFRRWLQTQYRDLAALNEEWETKFATWSQVRPFTTDQIKNRMASGRAEPPGQPDWGTLRRLKFDPAVAPLESTRWNFAPWADFRTYMDVALAAALDDLRRTARELDSATPVGIEGTQMPAAFGGYDLSRLARVLDWVEPYDIGNAREILGSFMPGKPILTTVFEKETAPARRRLWHLLLEGDRGCIVWWSEDTVDWRTDDCTLTAKGRALAPVFHELQAPVAALFRRARPVGDPIYLVYSQPSIQVDWLLESIGDGPSWLRRFSSYEAQHNRLARDRAAWMKLFQDLGLTPQFVAADDLAALAQNAPAHAVLVLSNALALSDAAIASIDHFLARDGRTVVTDGSTAVFDEHGRLRRERGVLASYWRPNEVVVSRRVAARADPAVKTTGRTVETIGRERLQAGAADWYLWAEQEFGGARPVHVPASKHVRVHRYNLGGARLLAFERNISYHMSEDLRQAGGNEPLEHPVEVTARIDSPAHMYDLRSARYLGRTDRLTFTLDPWQPSLFALLEEKVDPASVINRLGR